MAEGTRITVSTSGGGRSAYASDGERHPPTSLDTEPRIIGERGDETWGEEGDTPTVEPLQRFEAPIHRQRAELQSQAMTLREGMHEKDDMRNSTKQPARNSVLDKVLRWSYYRKSAGSSTEYGSGDSFLLADGDHRDSSTTARTNNFRCKRPFVFQRGFSTRRKPFSGLKRRLRRHPWDSSVIKSKFDNEEQLRFYLSYINLGDFPSLDTSGCILPVYNELRAPRCVELLKPHPRLAFRSETTLRVKCSANKTLSRTNSASRVQVRPSRTVVRRRYGSLRRTKSTSPVKRSSHYESLYPELYSNWHKYVHTVIFNQIKFRLHCLQATDETVRAELEEGRQSGASTSLYRDDEHNSSKRGSNCDSEEEFVEFAPPPKHGILVNDEQSETSNSIVLSSHSNISNTLKIY